MAAEGVTDPHRQEEEEGAHRRRCARFNCGFAQRRLALPFRKPPFRVQILAALCVFSAAPVEPVEMRKSPFQTGRAEPGPLGLPQAMVFGDRHPYLVAILVPNPEFVAGHAAEGTMPDLTVLAANPGFTRRSRVNQNLSASEQVRRFLIATEPFTIVNGLMTPTLRIKRHAIRDAYGVGLAHAALAFLTAISQFDNTGRRPRRMIRPPRPAAGFESARLPARPSLELSQSRGSLMES
jgi:hypothetical protein